MLIPLVIPSMIADTSHWEAKMEEPGGIDTTLQVNDC